VCASAGNFGQGLAYAARKHGVVCEVFASTTANPLKVERMRALGAQVRLAGADFDAAKAAARDYAAREGTLFVEDGKEPSIAEGAGSIATELARWPEPFTALVIPLGNGALLGGMATCFRSVAPDTRIIGVVAAGAPAMERSWRTGSIVETERADTIADGIAVRVPVPEALEALHDAVDDVVLVDEQSIIKAVRIVWATMGLMIEPAGAAGIAALIQHRDRLRTGLVGTVLCGANVTTAQMREWKVGTGA
jgi:threonine dehydratase